MKQALIYSLKVCLTAALLSPVLYLFPYEHFHGNEQESGFIFLWVPIVMFSGCCYVLPYMILQSILIYLLVKQSTTVKTIKLIISALIVASCFLVSRYVFVDDQYQLASLYAFVGLAGIWFYKLEPVNSTNRATTTII